MNKRNKLVLGLAVGLGALTPSVFAGVATSDTGMKACAEALIESIKADGQASSTFEVMPLSRDADKRLRRHQVIYLDAIIGDDDVVAKANCTVNADAEVQELELLANNAPEARRRAL